MTTVGMTKQLCNCVWAEIETGMNEWKSAQERAPKNEPLQKYKRPKTQIRGYRGVADMERTAYGEAEKGAKDGRHGKASDRERDDMT